MGPWRGDSLVPKQDTSAAQHKVRRALALECTEAVGAASQLELPDVGKMAAFVVPTGERPFPVAVHIAPGCNRRSERDCGHLQANCYC